MQLMILIYAVVILTYIAFTLRLSVLNYLKPISLFLHNKCLSYLPAHSQTFAELSALVCGHNFEFKSDSHIYITSGLIHLFVVSGSHLNLVHHFIKIWEKNIYFKLINLFILFIYCLCCLMNPPIIRSFIYILILLLLSIFSRSRWSHHLVILITGFICLALNPNWIHSLSLQMSWLALLALELFKKSKMNHNYLIRQIAIYLSFIFCFNLLGFSSFSTVLLSFCLTPLLEFILFPLSILVVIYQPIEFVFSKMIFFLKEIILAFEFNNLHYSKTPLFTIDQVIQINWILILSIHLFLISKKERS